MRAKQTAEARFTPLGLMELDQRFRWGPDEGDFGGCAIYVAPPRKQINTPMALWCRWDFRGKRCSCWYYLGMWLNPSQFIGYRFEMPESGNNHNYFPSQPCRAMGKRTDVVRGALPIPVGNPTWPLAARSALELLLCLVASIHGMQGLREMDRAVKANAKMRQNSVLLEALRGMFTQQS